MMYTLGDKFIYEGIECEVRYINHGCAWLASTEELPGKPVGYAFVVINEKGRSKEGKKVVAINKNECLAI